jgi:hypothetical protein
MLLFKPESLVLFADTLFYLDNSTFSLVDMRSMQIVSLINLKAKGV